MAFYRFIDKTKRSIFHLRCWMLNVRCSIFVVYTCLLLTAVIARAQVPGLEPGKPYSLGGYVEYLSPAVIPESGSTVWDHLIHQRFNFEVRWQNLSFAAGMRNRMFWGDSLDLPHFEEQVTADPGYLDLSWNWVNEDDVLGNTTFDRLYLDLRVENLQLRAGRQRINWGMATLWNPNDLFNVYSMFDVDYEERPGTDAVLVSHYLGFASRAEVVWGFEEDWDETSLAGRYGFNAGGFDMQILGGKQKVDLMVGAGFSGSFLGTGFNGEVSCFNPYVDEWKGVEQEPSTVSTLETDYSVAGKRNLTFKASVLHTSNPQEPGNALLYLNQPLTAKTISFTRWTGYGDMAFDITSLSRQTIGAAVYDDKSWFFTVSNGYSLADGWQLMLVWQHYDGPRKSLFGTDPADMIYGRIRWSF